VAGAFLFDDEAKSVFRSMLWNVADFCGVEVLAYCMMSNHFHILLRTPSKLELEQVSREELARRYEHLYANRSPVGMPTPAEMRKLLNDDPAGEGARWEARLKARMGDVSEFMKTLKQRFAVWYNHKHQRFGTLWAERFTSLLVEDTALARQTVAAYIALNPVRAGLVEDASAYRWSSYGDAIKGNDRARQGIREIEGLDTVEASMRNHSNLLKAHVLGKRDGNEAIEPSPATAARREFSAGVALGNESFVRGFLEQSEEPLRRRRSPKVREVMGPSGRGIFVFGSLREIAIKG
jgi:REP element-mobilizing transposase RayT